MPLFLLIVGALLVLAGMGSIAAGAPDWVLGLSLGATLIQSGTIAFVGGLIMIALGMVLIVLQDLLQRFDAAAANASRHSAGAMEARKALRPPRQQPAPAAAPESAPRREPPPESSSEAAQDDEHVNEPPRPRRERPREPVAEDAPRPRRPALLTPAPAPAPTDDRQRPRREAAVPSHAEEESPLPRLDRLPSRREAAAPTLEDEEAVLPRPDRLPARRDEPAQPRRDPGPIPPVSQPFANEQRRRPPESAQATPDLYAPKFHPASDPSTTALAPAKAAADTVVRSGVIGGMAYTLYADGSIEAELGIGTVRFNSIAELQDHVSRTGAEPEVDIDNPRR